MNEQSGQNPIENIKKLSIAERILIVEDIWDSIVSSDEEVSLSEIQKQELNTRLEAYYKDPNETKSWKEVRNNIQSQL